MKLAVITILLLGLWADAQARSAFPALDHVRPRASPEEQQTAVKALMNRVIGDRASIIDVVIKPIAQNGKDAYHLETVSGRLQITGTTGVAASMGFYYFLKEYCGCQYTWAGHQLHLPATFPTIVSPGVTIQVNDRFRYFQNVCTVSYSFAWYGLEAWESMIDWMAMQGINLPLAFTGQEAIFQKVFMSMGFTTADMDAFFGGPAFLAWARMGNIMGWGGPLPSSWIADRQQVQLGVLKRMRSLGMIPVLPAFAGHVPSAITRLFPNASVIRSAAWGGFTTQYTETYLLNFKDPLFKKIGSAFIQELINEFGVDHIYNADTFNEMRPSSSDPAYLDAAGKAVFDAMTAADPQAIWLMQGWLFKDTGFWGPKQVQALVHSVPLGRMIILDLEAEISPVYTRTKSFYGQPFIWNMLHNFGGTMALYGVLDAVNTGPSKGRAFPNSTMMGVGLTPEGIFQNEVVYEFMMEQAWRPGPTNVTQWISNFAVQRYGMKNANIDKAWQLLKQSLFSCQTGQSDHSMTPIQERPQLHFVPFGSVYNVSYANEDFDHSIITVRPRLLQSNPGLWFDPKDEYAAWGQLLQGRRGVENSTLFRYDLVDVTRDSLQTLAVFIACNLSTAYANNSYAEAVVAGRQMVELLSDMETLLASNDRFLLGKWIKAARDLGHTQTEKDLYEYNARNQITLWGPNANILDYAAKQWSGLFKDYFMPRWALFVSELLKAMDQGKKFDQGAFDSDVFYTVESPFTIARKTYPTTTIGDSLAISSQLYEKYKPMMEASLAQKINVGDHPPFDRYPSDSTARYRRWKM